MPFSADVRATELQERFEGRRKIIALEIGDAELLGRQVQLDVVVPRAVSVGIDEDTLRTWRELVDESARHFDDVYTLLGISLTAKDIYGESFYESMLADVIQEALDKKAAYRDEGGAVVVDLGDSTPTFLLNGRPYSSDDVMQALGKTAA